MSNDEDKTILICSATATGVKPVYGSIIAVCSDCRCGIWVSPSGRAIADAKLLCGNCAQQIFESDETIKLGLAPGSIEEAINHFRDVQNN